MTMINQFLEGVRKMIPSPASNYKPQFYHLENLSTRQIPRTSIRASIPYSIADLYRLRLIQHREPTRLRTLVAFKETFA